MESRRPPRDSPYGNRPTRSTPGRKPAGRGGGYRGQAGNFNSSDSRDGSQPRNPGPGGFKRKSTHQKGPGQDRREWRRDDRAQPGRFGTRGRPDNKKFFRRTVEKDAGPAITSELQITDGKLRGMFFSNSVSPNAAVTPRKLREIMFKIIARRVKARRMLDLGAGAGCIGLEAISRGAMAVAFVERSARMCSYLRKNLDVLGIKNGHGEVHESEIDPFLKKAAARRRFWDLVYMGVRGEPMDGPVFKYFNKGIPVAPRGLLMLEHDETIEYPEKLGVLTRWRSISNGGSMITFYERR